MLKKLKKWIPSKRKIMQLYFALLFNANLKGFVTGYIHTGESKNFCVPGINCYSCPGAVGACPLGSLQAAFSSKNHSTLYYIGGILLLYSIFFGRMICGWLCPFGLVQELCYKIKTPKLKKSPVTRLLSFLKYALLVFFVLIVPITYAFYGSGTPAFCKYICPAGVVEGAIPLLSSPTADGHFSSLGPLFTWKFLLTVSIIVGCVFVFRLFCRFICPLGALYGLFNKISIFGIKVDNSKCTHCGLCQSKCKMDIRTPGDHECISCGECVGVCPTQAILWKGPKIKLAANEIPGENPPDTEKTKRARTITRSITAAVMAAVLIGAIVYFWVNNDSAEKSANSLAQLSPGTTQTDSSLPPYGNTVGTRCYSHQLPLISAEGETGQTLDPSATGKVTVINFWGTWCSPCVEELPYFEQLAVMYQDQVCVLAIHSANGYKEAPGYIAEQYPQSEMLFSWDLGGDNPINGPFYLALDGTGGYPMTFVLDENGVITHIFSNTVTFEQLKSAVDAALAQ